jgi:hypothetical protein
MNFVLRGRSIKHLKKSPFDNSINGPIMGKYIIDTGNDIIQKIRLYFANFMSLQNMYCYAYPLCFEGENFTPDIALDTLSGTSFLFSFSPCKSLLTTMHDSSESSGVCFRVEISHFARINRSLLLLFSLFNLSFKLPVKHFG